MAAAKSKDVSREIIIAHLSPLKPASQVRSTLLQSSLNFVRERGHYDTYLRIVSAQHRNTIVDSLAPGWLSIEVAIAHYRACDALPLTPEERVAIGESVGDRIQGTFMWCAQASSSSACARPMSTRARGTQTTIDTGCARPGCDDRTKRHASQLSALLISG